MELLIFPRGKYFVEKYQKWFIFDDVFFKKIMTAFSNLPKPFIDIEHEEKESYGEIIELNIKPEGLFGKIELTEDGEKLLKQKVFRYISPAWGNITDNNGVFYECYLDSISLTNTPALLSQKKIQEQIKFKRIGGNMEFNKILLNQITDDAIKSLVNQLISQGEKLEEIIASLEKEKNELLLRVEELEKENEAKAEEIKKMETEQLEREADAFIKNQMEDGKLLAKHSDYWRKQYLLNKQEVIQYFENVEKNNDVVVKQNYSLSQEDIAVMKSLGMDIDKEEDVKFYLNVNKGGAQ